VCTTPSSIRFAVQLVALILCSGGVQRAISFIASASAWISVPAVMVFCI
jgi:hypothetical protein